MQETKQHYNYKDLSIIFSLLSSELRLRIIHHLSQQESTVSEIVARVDASKHNVSQQLKSLSILGIVERKKVGRFVYCKLKGEFDWSMVEQLQLKTSPMMTHLSPSNDPVCQQEDQKELSA
ncbi:MAG: winged helix-turn-helix transcriptional regulator [Bdellovibrionales bacterium]|jgi:DNA-binding transcriptional ArsR family regulator|nr:winged helix-turn-helix transcriptional regulator [Bdellovibrionales bacterium]MBT3525533.1 winged helix-turn-helix transcriptional regulator [Bdellovibrionales bacterium]MBT7670309.1 winged helix-turn-helix transcriptional regulator [Bdellovibrionales bacterium]MBT7768008.1 winged helix-turn-helix transcriptional regulator [Bdellovibrionales bacterium]